MIDAKRSILIDCGMFQGKDAKNRDEEMIEFPLNGIMGLVVTHIHLDHVGRIPYLVAAGFDKPIYCSPPSAKLLPLVLEDALRVGVTRNRRVIERFVNELKRQIRPVPYHKWLDLDGGVRMRFHPAGHVLGSAWVEFEHKEERFVFSGDLGTRDQPLLTPPASPERADFLVLESTYGDRLHENREGRAARLEAILNKTLENKGVTIIPAFSVGRTQELLFELNGILEDLGRPPRQSLLKAVDILIDSPMAMKFNEIYDSLRPYWSEEAKQVLNYDDQPLVFENLVNIESHDEHRDTIRYLKKSQVPAIVIAASGMCSGGRVVKLPEGVYWRSKYRYRLHRLSSDRITGAIHSRHGLGHARWGSIRHSGQATYTQRLFSSRRSSGLDSLCERNADSTKGYPTSAW